MRVLLTGGSGYLGSAILRRLVSDGHAVSAVARSPAAASTVAAAGAAPARGDAWNSAWLAGRIRDADAVIHAASPNDATSGALEVVVLNAVEEAFAGTGRTFVLTGGTWIHGDGTGLTEASPVNPPPTVAWRPAVIDQARRLSGCGIRSIVIAPAMLYGYGGGLPALLWHGPVTPGPTPALAHPGSGTQRVSNVAVDDAADFYALALKAAAPGAYYIVADDRPPSMREVAAAASRGRGLGGRVVAEPAGQSRARLGPLADPLNLDQSFDIRAARALGWSPWRSSLLEDLEAGSYALASDENRSVRREPVVSCR